MTTRLRFFSERTAMKPAWRSIAHRWSAKRRFAVRLPRDLKPDKPGGLIQIDTLFVNIAPDKAIKHFPAYCPVAK